MRNSVRRGRRECVWYLRRILGRLRACLHVVLRTGVHDRLQRRLVSRLLVGSCERTALGLALDVRRFVSNVLHRGLRRLLDQLLHTVLFRLLNVCVLRTELLDLCIVRSKLLDVLDLRFLRTVLQRVFDVHGRLRSL